MVHQAAAKPCLPEQWQRRAKPTSYQLKVQKSSRKWVGESEKAIREVFRKARMAAPAVVFLDEIDSLTPRRGMGMSDSGVSERVISQLLTEMDGITTLQDIVIIAATNRPDMVDSAVLRPGRFDRLIYVPEPDEKSRLQIFKIYTKGMPISKDVDLNQLTTMTKYYQRR